MLFCLVAFPSSNANLHGQVRKKIVLLGRSHLLLQVDHTSANISSSSWLLTLVWELHTRKLLSKAAYTFPETLKKYSSPLFRSNSQDSSKVEIALNHPKQIPQLTLLQNWLPAPSSALWMLVMLPRWLEVQELFEPVVHWPPFRKWTPVPCKEDGRRTATANDRQT